MTSTCEKIIKEKLKVKEMLYLLHSTWENNMFSMTQNLKFSYKIRQQMALLNEKKTA